MNRLLSSYLFISLFLNSCSNKTEQLLTKKWDCVRVDNLNLTTGELPTRQDSLLTAQVIAALETLSWSFKEDHQYECSVGGKVMVHGSYGLMEDNKTLICTPSSQNNINRYTITLLTDDELVLSSTDPPLVLHFRAH